MRPAARFCTLRRDSTNTPLQALVTLNDPCFVEAAQALARRVLLIEGKDRSDRERLQMAFRACTSRDATDRELNALERLLRQAKEQLEGQTEAAKKLATDPLVHCLRKPICSLRGLDRCRQRVAQSR